MKLTGWAFITKKETFLILYQLYFSILLFDFAKTKWEYSRIFLALTNHLDFRSGHIFNIYES